MLDQDRVYQFKIVLTRFAPTIWRRIQVPEYYSFWDLHVAIQDAMGWFDKHLHEFEVLDARTRETRLVGIPLEELELVHVAGWTVQIADLVSLDNPRVKYTYDFGDHWTHNVVLEKILTRKNDVEYPICVAGRGACPPEDVGGVSGYEHFLEVIANPRHDEHDETIEWADGRYEFNGFDPNKVRFDDPRERWENAFR